MRLSIRLIHPNTRTAIPVTAIRLVIYLDHIFAGSRDDTARIEHHAGDGLVVSVGVVDGACAEVPNLERN